ncbi:MAG: hypothetical protein ACOC4C_01395 [Fibrobacterota bacterium]
MKFDSSAQKTIHSFLQDPSNSRAIYELGALYWSLIIDTTGDILREQKDIDSFIDQHKCFLDYGIIDEIVDLKAPEFDSLTVPAPSFSHLKVHLFSDWMKDTVETICEGSSKKYIQRDTKAAKIQLRRIEKEISRVQDSRKQLLFQHLGNSESSRKNIEMYAEKLCETDQLCLQNLRTKKAIAAGIFFSVDRRREFVQRENDLQKQIQRKENLFSRVQSKEDRMAITNIEKHLGELSNAVVDLEETIRKFEQQLEEIEQKQSNISPVEIANRTAREIEYIRDLVKLSAKRLRLESCPVLRPGEKFFSLQTLHDCLERILEFDPLIFCNDRVSYLGKPSFLLVPGNGNGVYDWKNNQIVIPLMPPGGNFMGSIAAAMVEYRFDVDEDKKLLGSFSKLPSQKNTRSLFQLKERLTKSYIIWMTSEYKGFRVLPKEIKHWFEREIAPDRNDIYCPPQFRSFNMSSKEVGTLLAQIEERMQQDGSFDTDEFWTASILTFQQGEYTKAFEYINSFIQRRPETIFGYYNLGHMAMKVTRKQQAIEAFSEFIKRNPQTWWAGTARDHVRRLQVG